MPERRPLRKQRNTAAGGPVVGGMQGQLKKGGGSGPWGVVGAIEGGQAAGAYTLKRAGTLSDRLLSRHIRAKNRRKD